MVERLRRYVQVLPDAATAAQAATDRILQLANAAIDRRGLFSVGLSGGRTPEPVFRALAALPDGARRWPSWYVFQCDERWVPEDDARSNLGLARRLWLAPSEFPEDHVRSVTTRVPPEAAARRYEGELRGFFAGAPATFDAAVLGLGPDGHTASLFPGSATLDGGGRWVVAEPHPALPPDVPRVTLTLEALGRVRTAVFLVTGPEKREAVARVLGPDGPVPALPGARVTAQDGVEWYLDRDAAAGLPAPMPTADRGATPPLNPPRT